MPPRPPTDIDESETKAKNMTHQNHYDTMMRDSISLSNVAYHVDPNLAERYIRSQAQKALAKAILHSIAVGARSVWNVLSDASDLRRKHGTTMYHGL